MDWDKLPVLQMDYILHTDTEEDKEKKEDENHASDERKGLSLWLASVFIVGQMAGSGVLALPDALLQAGWSGIPLLIFCCVNSLYAGICLGRSWSILEERYDEYKGKIRYPYPAIAYRAFGKRMQYFVSFCIDVNLFGVSIVFLLLSSQLITSVAKESGVAFCYWISSY
ncbi:amino acid transporter AVT1E [Trichonephila inaurata madagascariensis]|uniref:Amino acid transporter AVT1E n=1 Tax=Trichonephila inaurata madagascariensis TaxID=2747483 RepID=A0A8X6WW32_9ARAC|nr:amino acid transporter AVT1E [Trichonephila inaurata madagascariensis]